MTVYNDILNQIKTLSISEQYRLFQDFKNRLSNSEDLEDDFNNEDLAESESEWQNYLKGKDQGKSFQDIELELFGGEID